MQGRSMTLDDGELVDADREPVRVISRLSGKVFVLDDDVYQAIHTGNFKGVNTYIPGAWIGKREP